MKPINKEDMPKLIVLIVLAVGIFGFALVQFISSSSPSVAATPAKAEKGTVVATAAGSDQAAAASELPASPELDFLHVGPPTGGKDPFIPNGSAALPPAGSADPVKVTKTNPLPNIPSPSDTTPSGYPAPLPSGGKSTVQVQELTEGPKPVNPAPVELPAPSWQVAGIVLAEHDTDGIKRGRDVAILRDGAGSRRFVTVGDPVNNGYVVSAVLPGGVEIRNKKRTTLINLDSSSLNLSERPGGTTAGSKENNGATTRAN